MIRTLTPFLSIIIAVLLALFFVQPQYEKVLGLQKTINEYKDAKEQYEEFAYNLEKKLKVKADRPLTERERLEVLVSDEMDDTHMLVDLEKIVKGQGMLFGNVSIVNSDSVVTQKEDEEESNELDTIDITFEVIGTYTQFKDLLQEIERSLFLYEVTSIAFTASEESQFHQYALTVRGFVLPKNN